ncbi:MAG: GNAT family N-acetyltransferase [Candidatus Schekmanbacteria bacterium]|nr:GNAT family N-acetyltransferase [Candidatus Schekmanbacteria bacterium]
MTASARVVTERLEVVAMDWEMTRVVLAGAPWLQRARGWGVAAGWADPRLTDRLPMLWCDFGSGRVVPGWEEWLVALRHPALLIGHVGFHGAPDVAGQATLGYHVAAAHRGKGLASEACRAVLQWGFAQPELTGVVAMIGAANLASQRVARRVGFVREPTGDRGEEQCWRVGREELVSTGGRS